MAQGERTRGAGGAGAVTFTGETWRQVHLDRKSWLSYHLGRKGGRRVQSKAKVQTHARTHCLVTCLGAPFPRFQQQDRSAAGLKECRRSPTSTPSSSGSLCLGQQIEVLSGVAFPPDVKMKLSWSLTPYTIKVGPKAHETSSIQ